MKAGHVVYIKAPTFLPATAGSRAALRVPGRNGNQQPFGVRMSTRFHSVRGWTEDDDEEYDYGAIVLPDPLGD